VLQRYRAYRAYFFPRRYNAAHSLGHYRVRRRHVREAVTTYRHNRNGDSKQVDVSTDDSCSLHAQKVQVLVLPLRNGSYCLALCLSGATELLAQSKVSSDAKLEMRSQVAATSDKRDGARLKTQLMHNTDRLLQAGERA